MNLWRFVVRNVFRNKRRAALTILSIAFSLSLLLIMLTFLNVLLNPVTEDEAAFRLIVSRSTSLADSMPIAYMDKIKRVPGVEFISPLQWFNGVYQDPKQMFANFATDPETIWDIYSEQKVSPETRAAFIAERTAAVAGEDLMKRYDWKVGDRITLLGNIFPVDLEFKIVGAYRSKTWQNAFYFRYDYLNEALDNINTVGSFVIKAKRAEDVPAVAQTIDALFRNTAAETKTETEKAFVLGFMSMLGNIKTIIGSVALVVVFTMLLVSVSTMSMAVRERIREVAILRAIGYPQHTVLMLILSEAVFLAMLGAVTGTLMAELLRFVDLNSATQGFVDKFNPPLATYAAVMATGLAIGLISGLIPAIQATRVSICSAMRAME